MNEEILSEDAAANIQSTFFLDDAASFFLVEQGFLDIFAVRASGTGTIGRASQVARLTAGNMAFGADSGRGTAEDVSTHFMAVPSLDAVVREGKRADLAAPENFDLKVTVWIDEWVFFLSEFLVREMGPPPVTAKLIEADPDILYPANSTLTAYHGDVVWVSANRPIRLVDHDDITVVPGDPLVPMTERLWVNLDSDTEVSAQFTPTAFASGRLWQALDAFNSLVLAYAAEQERRRIGADEEHFRTTVTAIEASKTRMVQSLANTMDATAVEIVESAETVSAPPIQAAMKLVARSVGVETGVRRGEYQETQPIEAANAFARASGMYLRRLSLAPGWWERNGPSFLGAETGEGQPIAVLSDGQRSYRAVNPSTGAAFRVGKKEAAGIFDLALMLYAPLPDRIRDGKSALIHCLRSVRGQFFILLAMALLAGLVALLTPIATGQLLAEVIPRVDTPMWIAYLGALLLGSFSAAIFEVVRGLATLHIQTRVDERLQSAVWIRLLSLPAPFFRNFSNGDLADRANGISQIRQIITGVVASSLLSGVSALFSFALLFWYSWHLALYATALVLVLASATWLFAILQMKHHRKAFKLQGAIEGLVFQMINGLAKLRIASAESHALARWAEQYTEQRREIYTARRWTTAQLAFNSMFMPVATLIIFAVIEAILKAGDSSFGLADFLSFNSAFGTFAAAVTGLTSAWTAVIAAIPLFERIEPILTAQPEPIGHGVNPGALTGAIEFSNVSFRYTEDGANAVDQLSFNVPAGGYVAFVGPSGSGKSTLYRLLLSFELPDSGSILLDGNNLRLLDPNAVRKQMGVVLQNSLLSAASIFQNIAGASNLTMDDAWEAARAVSLAEDIEAMPMGMHTLLSENGGGLSGGQQQRLLIARALALRPRILLFDEATSALDNRTQSTVQDTLKEINATRLVIAHRISTIRDADCIHVLEAGKIIESGRFDEMVASGGAFTELAKRQLS